jgi:hypothetical protein
VVNDPTIKTKETTNAGIPRKNDAIPNPFLSRKNITKAITNKKIPLLSLL